MNQDEQIRTLAEQGWVATTIAQVLGMSDVVVRRKLKEMGIDLAGLSHKTRNGLPYGMTTESYGLRAILGDILVNLVMKHKEPPEVVSSLTGLHRREISHAMKAPYTHDWKLSQIERTLKCEGKSINDIT